MLQIVLIRPGSTDFDEQGRIKGTLDIPLNQNGADQVARTAVELKDVEIQTIYTSPCQSAQQTAAALAQHRRVRIKVLDKLKNIDHGLWHGKLIDEVRQTQPRVYRQRQDHPETVCPPGGESLAAAQERVRGALSKLFKKHRQGVVALVVPEPLASVVRAMLSRSDLGDLWKAECACGHWELIEVESETSLIS